MKENYLEKLEYDKITKKLANFCNTTLGQKICLDLIPSNDVKKVELSLSETAEAVSVVYKVGNPPINEISDNIDSIKILESYGTLSPKVLLALANIFKLSENLKTYFYCENINDADFPILNNYFSKLYTNPSVYEEIFKCIIDEETISDNASKTLSSIRRKIKSITDDIKLKLNAFLHSSKYSKAIQENVITIRNDRNVIPIKEEYRSEVKGFIHDISSSGSTVFIEPISIFESNNEIAQLKAEEAIEIEKILLELTKSLYPYVNETETDIKTISYIDFIFAKAKYSKSLNAITPKINKEKEIVLKNAKHPLLEQSKAVPISLTLGKNFDTLIITGPNTGGKTVTLKTVGLLTCMACSGLNIPADSSSSIYVFENIFADIGDDQSISDSLSTFSSHMTNIVNIVKNANKDSLILLDELGSGTDPIEGAALATSILEYLKSISALTIATTHYQELKKYALLTDGFENASVEFNIDKLSPTYKLLIGIPGKSYAFDISKKLGLDNSIIENAKNMLNKDDLDFEELLRNIHNDKITIEKEREQIENELAKITKLRENLDKESINTQEKRATLLQNAKLEARNILLQAKEDATEIIREMNNLKNNASSQKDLNNYRNKLNSKIKDINTINSSNLNENSQNTNTSNNTINPEELTPNTPVFVTTLNQEGTVLSHVSKSNEVLVQIGNLKMNLPINTLELLTQNTKSQNTKSKNKNSSVSFSNISKSKTAKTEINVIGMNVEEATFVIDKFLDDSSLAKLKSVRIVHGKGTGKLRDGIHKFLKKNSHVKSFRLGTFGEGEMGVTIVELY